MPPTRAKATASDRCRRLPHAARASTSAAAPTYDPGALVSPSGQSVWLDGPTRNGKGCRPASSAARTWIPRYPRDRVVLDR